VTSTPARRDEHQRGPVAEANHARLVADIEYVEMVRHVLREPA